MSTPASKRRRIDAASTTLSKPFRSPLKAPVEATKPTNDQPAAKNQSTQLKNYESSGQNVIGLPDSSKVTSIETMTPQRFWPVKKSFSSPIPHAALYADPDIANLVKTQRELENQLREVREQLDVAEQARKIERASNKRDPSGEIDGELKALKQKWKQASREAAEDLFAGVRDRVNRYVRIDLLSCMRRG
jgi:Swi5-dependent recombination DNA repair protein 1